MFSKAIVKIVSWNNRPIYDGRIIASVLNSCGSFKDIGIDYNSILDFMNNECIEYYEIAMKSLYRLVEKSLCI